MQVARRLGVRALRGRGATSWSTAPLLCTPSCYRSPPSVAALLQSVRYASQGHHFSAACEGLPTTPSGRNPYDVLELSLSPTLPMTDIAKQYRQLVAQYHPDRPGGSTEKMTEINLAYKILKEHHEKVLSRWHQVAAAATSSSHSRDRSQEAFTGRARRQRPTTHGQQDHGPPHQQHRPRRPFTEITANWNLITRETDAAVLSMCRRYELAIQQGRFFRESTVMNEITARERWLRKSFIKSLWENVHELRGELLHRGTKNAQQSELAEEMVVFASQVQRKLNEDFQLQTQKSVQHQARMLAERGLMVVLSLIAMVKFWRWLLGARSSRRLQKARQNVVIDNPHQVPE